MTQSDLQAAVLAFGRVNFELFCTVRGAAARVVMDQTRIALVTAPNGVVGPPLASSFDEARASRVPDSVDVQVLIGGSEFTATCKDDADADRLVRVLGVRQNVKPGRPIDVPDRLVTDHYDYGTPPANDYERWAENTMFASGVLIGLAWLNLALGALAAIVIPGNGNALLALVWLLIAAAGCALPLCLGALARTVVYRFRQEDSLR